MANMASWTGVVVESRDVVGMLSKAAVAMAGPSLAAYMAAGADPYMRQRAQERFQSEGDAASGPWRPLRTATQDIRESLGYPRAHPINRRTGALEDFITQGDGTVTVAGDMAILELPGNQAQGDAELQQKLRTAQQGRDNPHTLPRPVVAMDMVDLQTVMTGLENHIMRAMGAIP